MAGNLRDHVVLSSTRARQARWGRHVLWVLLMSTALAALVLFGAWAWRAPDLARADNQTGSLQSAAAFRAPPPATLTRPNPNAPPGGLTTPAAGR